MNLPACDTPLAAMRPANTCACARVVFDEALRQLREPGAVLARMPSNPAVNRQRLLGHTWSLR